jgi:hypothetical protein
MSSSALQPLEVALACKREHAFALVNVQPTNVRMRKLLRSGGVAFLVAACATANAITLTIVGYVQVADWKARVAASFPEIRRSTLDRSTDSLKEKHNKNI